MKPALLLSLVFHLAFSMPFFKAQEPASASESGITLHASSDLVLIPVIALDRKNGLPDKTLGRSDFEVFDDDHPVSIKTFDAGAQFSTRPLALWLVVLCNMQGYEAEGSGYFRGRIDLLKPALQHLDKQDKVGVAHWCDEGGSRLDLLPTTRVEHVVTALEQALAPMPNTEAHDRVGELALQHTLQLIIDATRSSHPEPLPIIIFLYGDHSGMPRAEADHFINELLETSAVVFGLKDRRSPGIWWLPGEQKEVAHYIAKETGGEYLQVRPETYAQGLEEILRQLHFRYELGFKPGALDGKRHKLRVSLTGAARKQHKGVRLRNRSAYVPVASR